MADTVTTPHVLMSFGTSSHSVASNETKATYIDSTAVGINAQVEAGSALPSSNCWRRVRLGAEIGFQATPLVNTKVAG